jgi:hypothetical protein
MRGPVSCQLIYLTVRLLAVHRCRGRPKNGIEDVVRACLLDKECNYSLTITSVILETSIGDHPCPKTVLCKVRNSQTQHLLDNVCLIVRQEVTCHKGKDRFCRRNVGH